LREYLHATTKSKQEEVVFFSHGDQANNNSMFSRNC
jgi:hypothetical protein